MDSGLIQLLNSNIGATPDEIANKLNHNGWKTARQLGEKYFLANLTTHFVWCHLSVFSERPTFGGNGELWRFRDCSRNYDEFCDLLDTGARPYWLKPYSDYQHGEKPPCLLRSLAA